MSFIERLKDLPELIRRLWRGAHGQNIDDDPLSGLLHTNDPREMARHTEHDVYGLSGMDFIAQTYPKEMYHWKIIAQIEDVRSIAKDGEGRKEGVLALRAKMPEQPQTGTNLNVTLPTVETRTPQPEKKGGLFHRGAK